MRRRSFALGLATRLALLVAVAAAFAFTLWQPGLIAARLLVGLVLIGTVAGLWHHIGHTNREMARFVDALRYGDFSQGFERTGTSGFDELGQALGAAMRQLRTERAQANEAARIQAALVDESPAALLLVDEQDRVTLSNKAARKLFSRLPGTRVADFAAYSAELAAVLGSRADQPRTVLPLRMENAVQRAMVSRATFDRLGRPLTIVAVQPIQHELSAVELAAQADLVRVLTHEIMNSMTPVVSLAESAAALMAGIAPDCNPAIADAQLAVDTLARRASGILHFVEAYRAFSRAPVLDRRRFAVRDWAEELRRLFAASNAARGVAIDVAVAPADLVLDADPDLLAQVVINLLKNGAEAAAAHGAAPHVRLTAGLLPGGRTVIRVSDNGPGIPPDGAADMFLPFFTTKAAGTGVGLSLARRIVDAHGGTIAPAVSDGGACLELVL